MDKTLVNFDGLHGYELVDKETFDWLNSCDFPEDAFPEDSDYFVFDQLTGLRADCRCWRTWKNGVFREVYTLSSYVAAIENGEAVEVFETDDAKDVWTALAMLGAWNDERTARDYLLDCRGYVRESVDAIMAWCEDMQDSHLWTLENIAKKAGIPYELLDLQVDAQRISTRFYTKYRVEESEHGYAIYSNGHMLSFDSYAEAKAWLRGVDFALTEEK